MRIFIVMLASTAIAFANLSTAGASPLPAGELYRLGAASTWQRGCFEPCACPITQELPLTGTFRLVLKEPGPLFNTYDVTDVDWMVRLGDAVHRLTGSGTYRVGGEFAAMHELTLDLSTDGGPAEHFSSGLVVGGGGFPAIDIVISIHGLYCFDTAIHLVARPSPAVAYRLGKGSLYQQGCFDPCDCVWWQEEPLVGRFNLTPAPSASLYRAYKLTDIDWRAARADGLLHITGSGIYQIGGSDALTHRLELGLSINGDAIRHFDSGQVSGGQCFPAIDIEVTMNNRVCYDMVIHLIARPLGDGDLDGDVDRADFSSFSACISGPAVALAAGCEAWDFDDDGDTDLSDFGLFQRCHSGEGNPVNADCAD